MKKILILLAIITAALLALMMFNPWTAPSLDGVEPGIAAEPDGSAYYFAENRTYASYIIGMDGAGRIGLVYREAADPRGRRTTIGGPVCHAGYIWFIKEYRAGDSYEPDAWEVRRLDPASGAAETLSIRGTVGDGAFARLSADSYGIYVSTRDADGRRAFAYELVWADELAEARSALAADMPEDARVRDAVFSENHLYCAMSDGRVLAFSEGGQRVEFAGGAALALSAGGGGLFFADAASGALYFRDGGDVMNNAGLPSGAARVHAGVSLETPGFAALVSPEDGAVSLLRHDGAGFAEAADLHFSPAANIKFSLSAALTPAGAATAAAACLILLAALCAFSRTLSWRLILLQFCIVLCVVSAVTAAAYMYERLEGVQTELENTALVAEARAAEADAALRAAAAAGTALSPWDLIADAGVSLLTLRGGEPLIAASGDFPEGMRVRETLGPGAADLALDAFGFAGTSGAVGAQAARLPAVGGVYDDFFAAAALDASPDGLERYALLLRFSGAAQEYDLETAFRGILVRCGAAGLAAALLCACLTALWTRPLRRLPGQISAAAEKLRWNVKGAFALGEVGGVQKAIQEMFMSLSIREYEMGTSIDRYQRFMPQDLDRLLGRANLMEIEYGDFSEGEGAVGLIITSADAPARFGEDHHRFLEFVFAAFKSIHAAADGRAVFLSNSFSLTDFRLLFPGGGADGVRMGVRLATDAAEMPAGVPRPDFLLILHRARYEYGASGRGDRAITFMSSYELGLLARIAGRLSELGVKMLVTEQCGDGIGNAASTRYIGYVTSPDGQHNIKLYEVLDVYRGNAKHMREQYNDRFQEGIRLYYKNDFYLARNIFSEIFRNCPDDGVARWYIFACERLFNRTDFSAINYSIFGAE